MPLVAWRLYIAVVQAVTHFRYCCGHNVTVVTDHAEVKATLS